MNRRGFLQLLGAGLPATVVAEKLGLIDRVRSYFFAPPQGWYQGYPILTSDYVRRMLGPVRGDLLIVNPAMFDAFVWATKDGILQLDKSGVRVLSALPTEYTFGGLPVIADSRIPVGKFEFRDRRNFRTHPRYWQFVAGDPKLHF